MGEDKLLRVQFFLFFPISISHGTTWVEHLIDTLERYQQTTVLAQKAGLLSLSK